jgi:hypothetical protein
MEQRLPKLRTGDPIPLEACYLQTETRAYIHDGQEQLCSTQMPDTARPELSSLTDPSCNAQPVHTLGSISPLAETSAAGER